MSQETITKLVLILILLLLLIWRVKRGYRLGLVKEITSMVAIAAGLVSLFLFMLLYCSYESKTWGTTVVVAIMLIVFGVGYKIGKLILLPLRGLTALPILKTLDKLLGAAAGIVEFIAIAYAMQYVLILLEQPVLFAVPELL